MNEPHYVNTPDSTDRSSEDSVAEDVNPPVVVTATFQCPACRAKQVWSAECRRCKADLTLLRRFELEVGRRRYQLLNELRFNRNTSALRHAKRLYQLRPDEDAARLLAVCYLACGNFSQACFVARSPHVG